jgi:small subunit ribosomal protein S6
MRCYEHTFIARQDLSPQQAQALAETYAGVVTEQGGEVTKSEYWGLRNLAYRIRKNRKGHYLHLNLRASSAAIDELERQERLSDDVIRYLTVRVEELDDSPSIVMQVRSSREDRSRRPHDDGPRRSHDDGPRRSHDDGPRRGHEDGGGRRSQDGERGRRSAATVESATEELAGDAAGDPPADAE